MGRKLALTNTILIPGDGRPITNLAGLNGVIEQADAAGTGRRRSLAGANEIDLAGDFALTSGLSDLVEQQPFATDARI